MQQKVPAEERCRCEEPCGYREEADGCIKRSPSSPCGCSPQPGYPPHPPREKNKNKGQDAKKKQDARQHQAEAEHREGRARRSCPTPLLPHQHNKQGDSKLKSTRLNPSHHI